MVHGYASRYGRKKEEKKTKVSPLREKVISIEKKNAQIIYVTDILNVGIYRQ